MPGSVPSKLFHAIVGLGLAAVSCGGETAQSEGTGGPKDASGNADASSSDAQNAEDARVASEGASDAVSTSEAEAADAPEFDAVMARDAARDVAHEVWFPPIK